MSIINNDKVAQKAIAPRAVGTGQNPQVKQVEGSLLGTPKTASQRTAKTPHL